MFMDATASLVFFGATARPEQSDAGGVGRDYPRDAAIYTMGEASDIDKGAPSRAGLPRRLILGRPKWTNIALIASVVIFWAGVILKLLS
jgi:hypothetical protein